MAVNTRGANREAKSRYNTSNEPRIIDDGLMQGMRESGFRNVYRKPSNTEIIIEFTMPYPNQHYTGHISYHFSKEAVESAAGAFHIVLTLPDASKIVYRFVPVINNNFLGFDNISYLPKRPDIYGGPKPVTLIDGVTQEIQSNINEILRLMNTYKLPVIPRALRADVRSFMPKSLKRREARAAAAWENFDAPPDGAPNFRAMLLAGQAKNENVSNNNSDEFNEPVLDNLVGHLPLAPVHLTAAEKRAAERAAAEEAKARDDELLKEAALAAALEAAASLPPDPKVKVASPRRSARLMEAALNAVNNDKLPNPAAKKKAKRGGGSRANTLDARQRNNKTKKRR